jgi:hypothetical protein
MISGIPELFVELVLVDLGERYSEATRFEEEFDATHGTSLRGSARGYATEFEELGQQQELGLPSKRFSALPATDE